LKIKLCFLFLFYILNLSAQKDSIYIKKLLDKAYNLEISKPDSALILYDSIINFSIKKNSLLYAAKANNYKGIVYSDMGNYDSAIVNYNKSKAIFKSIYNDIGVAANLINIGNTFQFKGNYLRAIAYYIDGISIYEKAKDTYRLSISYGNLASIYDAIGQDNDAKNNLLKSNKYAEQIKDSVQLVNNYYNLFSLYIDAKKVDSAAVFLKKAKVYLGENKNPHLRHLVNYGDARYFVETGNYHQAEIKSKQALFFVAQTKDPFYSAQAHALLGEIYLKLAKYKKALIETHKALKISTNSNNIDNLVKIDGQLSDIYEKTNQPKKALYYKKLELRFKDRILNEKRQRNINQLQIKFETAIKDKAIIQQQVLLEKKQTQFNYMIVIALFSLISAVLVWFSFLQRHKRKNQEIATLKREHQIKSLELLIEGEEKERLRIAKELHDGVNGDLSSIKYKLSSIQQMNNKIIDEVVAMIDKSCKQVRTISHNLVPPSLENFNLIEATETFCQNNNAIYKPAINFHHIGTASCLQKKEEINIFRIIQELVTNSIKHAEATEIDVQISCRDSIVQITIEDNGKGFDINNTKGNGIGLQNIKSRVDYLQATIDVISNDKGTSYTIEIDKDKLNDH
jgi:signal transduction histidine kinase